MFRTRLGSRQALPDLDDQILQRTNNSECADKFSVVAEQLGESLMIHSLLQLLNNAYNSSTSVCSDAEVDIAQWAQKVDYPPQNRRQRRDAREPALVYRLARENLINRHRVAVFQKCLGKGFRLTLNAQRFSTGF